MNSNKLKVLKDLVYLKEYNQIRNHDYFTDRFLIHSPLYLPDIKKAICFLEESIKKKEKIFIFSDKDVDGITSTVILYDYLSSKFPEVPIQYRNSSEGEYYGITSKILEEIQKINPDLIIFLDMGSSHINLLKEWILNQKKIMILDHHIPQLEDVPIELLEKIAFVNPLLGTVLLEHENKIPTVGLVFKFILGFELYLYGILEKHQILKDKGTYYLYKNGCFIKKIETKEELLDYQKKVILIDDIAKYFPEVPYENLQKLLEINVYEIGKYITCISIELRKNILNLLMLYSTLAAIGYIADYVPLIGENRTIVKAGLGLLRYPLLLPEGLKALLQQLGLNVNLLTSRDIGWNLAPVINAAGRTGETKKATDLLLEKNLLIALKKANLLIELNQQRKNKTRKNMKILNANLDSIDEIEPFVFFYNEQLESGVSGIMAAKLSEKYQKPAIWINPEGEFAKGSIRSWNRINVLEMLMDLKDLFVDLGGHPEAAGFTIEYEKIDVLKEELKKISSKQPKASDQSFFENSKNYLEFGIKPEFLGEDLAKDLRLLEPFGNGNKEIYFTLNGIRICNIEIFNEKHIKFQVIRALTDIEFILWNGTDILGDLKDLSLYRWDISGIFERNVFSPIYSKCKYKFFIKTMVKKEKV
ncbi:MAG: DHHA1 domain-containing protein [Leptonema sp. (in: bacteria)]